LKSMADLYVQVYFSDVLVLNLNLEFDIVSATRACMYLNNN